MSRHFQLTCLSCDSTDLGFVFDAATSSGYIKCKNPECGTIVGVGKVEVVTTEGDNND